MPLDLGQLLQLQKGSVQSPTIRGSQSVSRGRGRGRGNASGSQGTVSQSAQGSAPARVYTMRQQEKTETLML